MIGRLGHPDARLGNIGLAATGQLGPTDAPLGNIGLTVIGRLGHPDARLGNIGLAAVTAAPPGWLVANVAGSTAVIGQLSVTEAPLPHFRLEGSYQTDFDLRGSR